MVKLLMPSGTSVQWPPMACSLLVGPISEVRPLKLIVLGITVFTFWLCDCGNQLVVSFLNNTNRDFIQGRIWKYWWSRQLFPPGTHGQRKSISKDLSMLIYYVESRIVLTFRWSSCMHSICILSILFRKEDVVSDKEKEKTKQQAAMPEQSH